MCCTALYLSRPAHKAPEEQNGRYQLDTATVQFPNAQCPNFQKLWSTQHLPVLVVTKMLNVGRRNTCQFWLTQHLSILVETIFFNYLVVTTHSNFGPHNTCQFWSTQYLSVTVDRTLVDLVDATLVHFGRHLTVMSVSVNITRFTFGRHGACQNYFGQHNLLISPEDVVEVTLVKLVTTRCAGNNNGCCCYTSCSSSLLIYVH